MAASPLLGSRMSVTGPKRQRPPSTRRLFSILVFLTVACGCVALLALDPGLLTASPTHRPIAAAGRAQREAPPLSYPIWWHAPFFSMSGLGTEAITILEALIKTNLLRTDDLWITHSGDTPNSAYFSSLPPQTAKMLKAREHPQKTSDEWLAAWARYGFEPEALAAQLQVIEDMEDKRQAIAVCHMWFDCWRLPSEKVPSNMPGCPCPLSMNKTAYTVARTMFETAGLPKHLAKHVAAMDEVWVPTEFNRQSFADSGIDRKKIFLVPEAIDPAAWSPGAASPIDLRALRVTQVTGPTQDPGWVHNASWVPEKEDTDESGDEKEGDSDKDAEKGTTSDEAPTGRRLMGRKEGEGGVLGVEEGGDGVGPTRQLQENKDLAERWRRERQRRLERHRLRRQRMEERAAAGAAPAPAAAAAPAQSAGKAAAKADAVASDGVLKSVGAKAKVKAALPPYWKKTRHPPRPPIAHSRPFVFLSVFKWEARKGWKELLEAFTSAFSAADNVQLLILARPFQSSGDEFDVIIRDWLRDELNATTPEALAALPRVYVSGKHVDEATFVRVYKSVDALVIPTHGEGWGRPQMEAMAMELPVISTNWSGLTEFLSEAVAYPLPIDGLVNITADGPGFFSAFIGQRWAQPSVSELARLMRHVAENREEAQSRGKAARRMVLERYTPEVLARSVDRHVRRIQATLAAREKTEAGGWWGRRRRDTGGGRGGGGAATAAAAGAEAATSSADTPAAAAAEGDATPAAAAGTASTGTPSVAAE